jgi:hypothetical protein
MIVNFTGNITIDQDKNTVFKSIRVSGLMDEKTGGLYKFGGITGKKYKVCRSFTNFIIKCLKLLTNNQGAWGPPVP